MPKRGDGEIGAVEADQGDVGAMERGDEREMDAAGGEHLFGEVGRDGVRNGVMDVEEVKAFPFGDLRHAGGEGKIVGRVLEERVVEELNLVEVDVGFAAGETEGRGRGDEVNVVATGGELDAELSSDDAGAAVGGVAGDADAEGAIAGRRRFRRHKTFS